MNNMENTDKQPNKQFDWLKQYQWQKGQSGNPKGRPKGKTLKEWVREFLMSMSEEARIEFLKSLSPDIVWKMAEGNPQTDITSAGEKINPIPILNVSENPSNKQNTEDVPEGEDRTGGNECEQDSQHNNLPNSPGPER